MSGWFLLLSSASAYTFHVPGDGSFAEALADVDADLIVIDQDQDLSLEEPFTIDRDLRIEGAGGVLLPPFAVADVAVEVRGVQVVGETGGYAAGASGGWLDCAEAPCTVLQVGGSLLLEQVLIQGVQSAHAIHTVDGDLRLLSVEVSDCFGEEYVILVQSDDVPVTASVEDLRFSGNNGPVKFFDAGDAGMDVTVEDSKFWGNEAWIAPDLYLWGVEAFSVSNVSFMDSVALSPERGAFHLTDSSGIVSAVEFSDGPGMTAISEDAESFVEIYGLTCTGTHSEQDGGCLYASGLDDLRVFNLWAIESSSDGWGGAVYAEGDEGATLRLEELTLIGTVSRGPGGGVAVDNLATIVLGARFCGTSGDEGSALYIEDGRLDINEAAFQGTLGGPALFTQNVPLNAGNMTFIGGEDHCIDGRPDGRNWHISNSIFLGGQRVTSQDQAPTMELTWNLFWEGAATTLEHGEGFIEADPLLIAQDLYDCYEELRPGPGSPAIDGNPTLAEPDGTGVRDLGWIVGQEAEATVPDSGLDDSGVEVGYQLKGASGGCASVGGAVAVGFGLLGLLIATTRRR